MPEPSPAVVRSLIAEVNDDPGDVVLTPIPGGASRETWLIQAGNDRWVLRRDPEGSVSLVPIENEYALISLAFNAGVPVPEPMSRIRSRPCRSTDCRRSRISRRRYAWAGLR